MKKIVFVILLCCILVQSCNKLRTDEGKITYRFKFTDKQQGAKSASNKGSVLYSQFGDYIISLTPYSFKSDLNFLYVQGEKYVANFVNGHDNSQPPELFVDFMENQEVEVNPGLMKSMTSTDNEIYWNGVENYTDNLVQE